MYEVKDELALKEELENLREKINKYAAKNIRDMSEKEYKNLLDMSVELDCVIVNYIKTTSRQN